MSGYGPEESEEMMGRVISVMDSSEHFKDQAVLVLREVRGEALSLCLLKLSPTFLLVLCVLEFSLHYAGLLIKSFINGWTFSITGFVQRTVVLLWSSVWSILRLTLDSVTVCVCLSCCLSLQLSESDASTQLPLVCIAAVDLLLCLITRSAYLGEWVPLMML